MGGSYRLLEARGAKCRDGCLFLEVGRYWDCYIPLHSIPSSPKAHFFQQTRMRKEHILGDVGNAHQMYLLIKESAIVGYLTHPTKQTGQIRRFPDPEGKKI